MSVFSRYLITYRRDEHDYQARTRIDAITREDGMHYQAVLESSPLRATYGGTARSVEGALDFLNLAMQAEGADDIHATALTEEAAPVKNGLPDLAMALPAFQQNPTTQDAELELARERLHRVVEEYIQTEAEVRALEQGAFRVVIFGSARIRPHDTAYQQVFNIARALAERGIDIVTGGGPGLMESANSAVLDVVGRESRSYGLPIDIPSIQEPANKHLDIKSSHRRFSSRLDEFMRLSNAVIVAPGGIGTLLELVYVWQLLQVGYTNDRPVILLNREVWGGLLNWMHDVLLGHGYISAQDFRWITVANTEEEVINLITVAHERFMRVQLEKRTEEAEDLDRTITEEVVQAAQPTELTEEGTGG